MLLNYKDLAHKEVYMTGALVLAFSFLVNAFSSDFLTESVAFLFGAWYITHVFGGKHRILSASALIGCVAAAVIMGLGAYCGIAFGQLYLLNKPEITVPFIAFFYFLFLALACDNSLFSAGINRAAKKPQAVDYLMLAGLLLAALFVIYKDYFPYGTSPDTINQWNQIHGKLSYNTIHSIGHTIFLKVLLSICDSYTIVIIVHILGIIWLYLLFASWFCSKGIDIRIVAFVEAMSLLWAGNKAYFFPWKDLPAALCIGFITYCYLKISDQETISAVDSFGLGLAVAWTALFRLNGIIAAVVCGVSFLYYTGKRGLYRQLLAGILAVVVAVGGVKCYTDFVLKPVEMENGFSLQILASGIAAVAAADELTPEEEAAVSEILSIDWMKSTYHSSMNKRDLIWRSDRSERISQNADLQIFNNEFVLALGAHKKAVVLLFLKLLPHHLGTILKDLIGSMKMTWALDSAGFISNHITLILVLILLSLRANLKLRDIWIFVPCICNTVSIMISTITNEVRYLLPTFFLLPAFLLFILWKGAQTQAASEKGIAFDCT